MTANATTETSKADRKRILFARASSEAPRTIVVRMTIDWVDADHIKHGPELKTVESSAAGVFEILPSDPYYDMKLVGMRKACQERLDIVEIPEAGGKVVPHPLNQKAKEAERRELSALEKAQFTEVIESQAETIRRLTEENAKLKGKKKEGE